MSSGAPVKAPEPELTPAKLALDVVPLAGGSSWRIRVTNKEDVPVRIAADPRLLVLELTPPTGAAETTKKPTTKPAAPLKCVLPADIRPSSDEGHDLVLPPSRSWSATIDPLFYCFGARQRAALVAGTSVKASFGWPVPPPRTGARPKAPSAPFAAAPVGAGAGKLGPLKAIDAEPFALSETLAPVTATKTATPESGAEPVRLSMPAALDVARSRDLSTTVTLTNDGDRALTLLFRPNLLQFTVVGPRGTTTCGEPRTVAAPIRELFTTVGAKRSAQTAVLVSAVCPPDTFDEAGIYRVTPRLDTTNASGRSTGLATWDGVAVGKAPLLVRVRSSRSIDLKRPTVD